ncbi:hypothetical protein AXF42_Ash000380 [Apostasia shenzhenica]|uniref:Uncharacterized protein n=1 Tax=Apostasia shenzhenica TaxID=1088818 RepID=A0A2I0AGA1_9ASPA|nr:hypothetical protein AXF42_Ash000380 [Apostasia shenzhenica]
MGRVCRVIAKSVSGLAVCPIGGLAACPIGSRAATGGLKLTDSYGVSPRARETTSTSLRDRVAVAVRLRRATRAWAVSVAARRREQVGPWASPLRAVSVTTRAARVAREATGRGREPLDCVGA